jgi:hypothetical protein
MAQQFHPLLRSMTAANGSESPLPSTPPPPPPPLALLSFFLSFPSLLTSCFLQVTFQRAAEESPKRGEESRVLFTTGGRPGPVERQRNPQRVVCLLLSILALRLRPSGHCCPFPFRMHVEEKFDGWQLQWPQAGTTERTHTQTSNGRE